MTTSAQDKVRLDEEIESHRQALRDFIASAESFDSDAWNTPRRGDQWSAAQVAEHLRLTYVTIVGELSGQGGFRIRTRWWQRPVLRLLFLPGILKRGQFPTGVRATREIRPGNGPFDRQELLKSLVAEGEQFLRTVASTPIDGVKDTHPYLGKLGLLDGLRFTTQHVRHHHGQIVDEAREGDS